LQDVWFALIPDLLGWESAPLSSFLLNPVGTDKTVGGCIIRRENRRVTGWSEGKALKFFPKEKFAGFDSTQPGLGTKIFAQVYEN
jgi:hypothetical protein